MRQLDSFVKSLHNFDIKCESNDRFQSYIFIYVAGAVSLVIVLIVFIFILFMG